MTEIPTEALEAAARAYCLARFQYPQEVYATPEALQLHIAGDASEVAEEPWLTSALTAAAPYLIAETIAQLRSEVGRLRTLVRAVESYGIGYRWRRPDGPEVLLERELRCKIAAEIRTEANKIWPDTASVTGVSRNYSVGVANWAARIAEGADHADPGTTWQPGDPVYPPRPAQLVCVCGTEVLWAPDLPDDMPCPECGGPMSRKTDDHG